jgi:hypothetical protein
MSFCLKPECVSAKEEYRHPNTETFKEHRYDQSILTNLKIKHNLYSSDVIRRLVTCNVPLRTKLSDVTFVIPVFFDGKDRENNINAVVQYIQGNTSAKIIIGEQLEEKFNYFSNVEYVRFDKMMEFHRTLMINEMSKMATTEIVVVCDADTFIPMGQYDEAIRIISANEADVVYPYSSFVKLDQGNTDKFLKKKDIFELSGVGINSYGGMIFFNKDQFIRSGMYNTNFICWGVEDLEIYHRLEKLGFVIKRVEGNLYHLNHRRGVNSTEVNDYYQNNVKEYKKVKLMDKKELEEYVKNNFIS